MPPGVDTESGRLRAVLNGVRLRDRIENYFTNSSWARPRSLAGRLQLFKHYLVGMWYQSRVTMSNVQVFASLLPEQR